MNRASVGAYASELQVAAVRSGWIVYLVAAGWIAFPFVLQTLLHPGDVINLHYVMQGEAKRATLTAQQTAVGFVETVFVIAVLLLVQLVGTVLFYRRAQVHGARIATPMLWPAAALLPGVIGNALWFVFTGEFDMGGSLIGLAPMALTFGAERLCEKLGRDFVLGPRMVGLH
ncbi:MAG: hypothetical protein AB7F35_16575 [Acetobacteraceae bacterium]